MKSFFFKYPVMPNIAKLILKFSADAEKNKNYIWATQQETQYPTQKIQTVIPYKNPAYGGHQIFRPMRIVAPLFSAGVTKGADNIFWVGMVGGSIIVLSIVVLGMVVMGMVVVGMVVMWIW